MERDRELIRQAQKSQAQGLFRNVPTQNIWYWNRRGW
jgi:hypothetical protein